MPLDLLTLLFGLVLLVGGAELLVRAAARLAAAFGLSALAIGSTIVAYGTSAPEMAVSVSAALQGRPDLALGNAVGSNTFNVLAILGVTALVAPLAVSDRVIRTEIPLMVAVSALAWWLAADGSVDRTEGFLLLLGGLVYTVSAVRAGRIDRAASDSGGSGGPRRSRQWLGDLASGAAGLVLLVWGARWLVAASVSIAREVGLSELTIGVTVVAAGTSLPELATSVVAARRGQRDIAVGNVVGSNLFNLLAVLAAGATLSPAGVAASARALDLDFPVMVIAALFCLPLAISGRRVDRWEGLLLLGGYVAYVAYLLGSPT